MSIFLLGLFQLLLLLIGPITTWHNMDVMKTVRKWWESGSHPLPKDPSGWGSGDQSGYIRTPDMNWCLHMQNIGPGMLPSSHGMLPGGWLHPPHHRSCSRHQRRRRSQSCMARPHIADRWNRWSLGVAHFLCKDPWSGLNPVEQKISGHWSFWW